MSLIANAMPTKDFFVTKITRDITLEDCILDLIDNCLDGARRDMKSRNAPRDDYGPYWARITLDEDIFMIEDNCGGISINNAQNYAFHFGRRPDAPPEADFPIGLYGIGMKRAIFKIGNQITITSTTEKESFSTQIVVDQWVQVPEWQFELIEQTVKHPPGTSITIVDLLEEISREFDDEVFVNRLIKLIARDYSFFLSRGFKVEVNGDVVSPYSFALKRGGEFEPANYSYTDGTGVEVDIVAGLAGIPPDDVSAEAKRRDTEYYGWFVACNDRIILAADKSNLTVWGHEGFNAWHPQYNGFMGIVNFHSSDPKLLPWRTTKREVEQQDPVYRRARIHMKTLTNAYMKYTTARRGDLERAKQLELAAETVPIKQLSVSGEIKVPAITVAPRIEMANIGYSVEVGKVKRVAEALGNRNLSYKSVGLRTFDYFYENEVGE